jgi:hypothetical protein
VTATTNEDVEVVAADAAVADDADADEAGAGVATGA